MIEIRLSKPANESGGVAKPPESVTVACPDHLVIAELPVAKSLGTVNPASQLKTVGRRSRRQLGERVHFCVRCDFPIAVYGRLSPCEHIFCLDCARSDSLCYLCEERIQKIHTIKMLEGVYICAAPHCLKSFLKKTEFESHVHEVHSDLLRLEQSGNISESASARKQAASDSIVQAPSRPIFSPGSGSHVHDREDKALHSQTRDQQPPRPLMQQKPLQQLSDDNPPPGFERPGMQSRLPQQRFDAQGSSRPDPGHIPDKQQGIMGSSPFHEYPTHMPQSHGFAVPMSSNPGFPPGAAGNMNFPENYPRPSNMGQPMSLPPPPPLPHHMSQHQRAGRQYSGDTSRDGQGYGWQNEKRDNFGSS